MTRKSTNIGPNELILTKPVSAWNRDIDISTKDLLLGIGKMVVKGASLDFGGVGEIAVDTMGSAGLHKGPGEIAWILISRALFSAISKLTQTFKDLFENPTDESELEKFATLLDDKINTFEVTIDLDFFQRPSELKLLKDVSEFLIAFMASCGVSSENAEKICSHLPDYFVTALHEQWCKSPLDYAILSEHFATPFTEATEEGRRWNLYNQWLRSQVSDRMFAEPFGVEKVYIPLRAYYEEKIAREGNDLERHGDMTQKKVFDLEKDLMHWLNDFPADTAVRFISGGPGSGKSTFSKMFASRTANEMNIPTLYIPLHLFDPTGNLITAMGKYIEGNKFLTGNPLDAKRGKSCLFIIFDGLDELASQGKAAAETANAFVDEVLRRIHEGNVQGMHRQVLISGRTISIQSVASKLRGVKQISYVLPYLVGNHTKYADPEKLLTTDQRQQWWRHYFETHGKSGDSMPSDLKRKSLEEITSQPLLNYLVALSYEGKRITFSDDTTLNQIYADLISEVYRRQYEDGRVNAYVGGLTKSEFVRILEEIALAIWHGDGRTASVSGIQKKCTSGGIQKYLESFQEGAKAGVTSLLTAFYFRQSEGRVDGDPTFEFTHKSFGEYLTALRIVRTLRRIQTGTQRRINDPDDGWSKKDSIEQWVEISAITTMDEDILRFIYNEFRNMPGEELTELQGIVADLLRYIIKHGLSFPSEFSNDGFKQLLARARNAEEALLAMHCGIAQITQSRSSLELEEHDTSFGEWISRLRGQLVQGRQDRLAIQSLGFLDLSSCNLAIQDFYGSNFQGSNLSEARLSMTNFEKSNLNRAILKGAIFELANLRYANLGGADLANAFLDGANLTGANLTEADLTKADLISANLCGAKLVSAHLVGANLIRTDLKKAKLMRANLVIAELIEANLEGANLEDANLQGTNLDGAELKDANLKDANLEGANLEGANLEGANLEGANLEGANLEGANLRRANLEHTNLSGANLKDAELKYANLKWACLFDANLQGANLEDANLEGTILEGTILETIET